MDPTIEDRGRVGDEDPEGHRSDRPPGLEPFGPPSLADRISDAIGGLDALRDRPALVALVVAVLAVATLAAPRLSSSGQGATPVDELIPQVALTPTSAAGRPADQLIVHVSGAVAAAGVYSLPSTARVIDAVEAAGGASPGADLHQLNLAAVLVDGQQIRVPLPGEVVVPADASGGAGGPIDVNRADAVQLQALPGVGPATAEAIVAFREEHGPFRSIDDLLDVPGIGPSKLAAIADAAIVR